MQRWRISDGSAFLLRCMVHAPALGGAILVVGSNLTMYVVGFSVYKLEQLPIVLFTCVWMSALAAILGTFVGLLPGLVGGCVLLLLSHFRAPTTLEFVAVAALSAAPIGLMWGMPQDPMDQYYPFIFAVIGTICALLLQPGARRRGIIVLDVEAVGPASPALPSA